jgi:ribosomal protein S18 acetylase RimI-like enzyme
VHSDELRQLLDRIERYLDAAPRSATSPEDVGKFVLFRPNGPWPYYARPRLGLTYEITAADVDELRAEQRHLQLPENIEWVLEITPSLATAAADSGLAVVHYPMLVFGTPGNLDQALAAGLTIRRIGPVDPDFAAAHAVADVGFRAAGTQVGSVGAAERDAFAAAFKPGQLEFMRDRARRELSISYAAFDETGPVAIGTHQPVGDTTEIVGVATLPVARRRGIAGALTAALVRDAQSRGLTTIFLSAGSDDVARVYERVGFRRIGHAGAAETPSG